MIVSDRDILCGGPPGDARLSLDTRIERPAHLRHPVGNRGSMLGSLRGVGAPVLSAPPASGAVRDTLVRSGERPAEIRTGSGSKFGMRAVNQDRFVLVAAPIGQGPRFTLNIYEQVRDTRACFVADRQSGPASVNPLLRDFDFTGICRRYLDGNGYSVRIGGDDLSSSYRVSVIRRGGDVQLVANPVDGARGSSLLIARAGGEGNGFLNLQFEPGWKLMQREFQGKPIGHMYLYRDIWP